MTDAVDAAAPLPLDALPEQFRRHIDPNSPPPLRLMAAQGLVPMPPGSLVTALYMLAADADDTVASTADSTLQDLPSGILGSALAEPLDIRVLDALAQRFIHQAAYIDAIVMNVAAADETIHWIATKAKERQLELIANNQVRLLRHTKIIEALYFNPNTRMSSVDRVIDFAVRSGVYLDGIPAFEEAAKALGLEAPEPGGPPPQAPPGADLSTEAPPGAPMDEAGGEDDQGFAQYLRETLAGDDAADESGGEALSDLEREFGGGEEGGEGAAQDLDGYESAEAPKEEEEEKKFGRMAEIGKMKISQKVRLALLGSKTDRGILIRDRNRLVCMSVIKSPKVQVQEAISYAGMRNISDEVIRYIAAKRQWQKNYQMKLALVRNPNTPAATGLKLLPHLRKSDLRSVTSDKNVSHVVSTQAKRMLKR